MIARDEPRWECESMGTFHVSCKIENHTDGTKAVHIQELVADTDSEYTWVPAGTLEKIGVVKEKRDLQLRFSQW